MGADGESPSRDMIAAMALSGIMQCTAIADTAMIAKKAYAIADAMIAAREAAPSIEQRHQMLDLIVAMYLNEHFGSLLNKTTVFELLEWHSRKLGP